MRPLRSLSTVVFALGIAAGCSKVDAKKCEQAARNYATLVYWERADAEIAKLPADQQALERSKREAAFANELETRINVVTQNCRNSRNEDQADCMIAAKTGADARKCADLASR